MLRFWIFCIVSCFVFQHGRSQVPCDITNHYADFIQIKRHDDGRRKFISKQVFKPVQAQCFSDLVSDNTMFIYYLVSGFTSDANHEALMEITDDAALQQAYFADLSVDTMFNSIMKTWVEKAIDHSLPKDTISMDALMNVAVKFFSVIRVMDDGTFIGKVGAGLYDIKKTLSKRAPFLEAFVWTSISANQDNQAYQLNEEFNKAIQALYKIELGIDPTERVFRAQGAMYFIMKDNVHLRDMLKDEYKKHEKFLPFVLVSD